MKLPLNFKEHITLKKLLRATNAMTINRKRIPIIILIVLTLYKLLFLF